MRLTEILGTALGGWLAPWITLGSFLRGKRLFHPRGDIYSVEVIPLAKEGPLADLSQRLAGSAIARLSGGFYPGANRPDVLGVAIRFGKAQLDASATALPSDQDMLFATIRKISTLPIAAFATDWRDFLNNEYYGLLPFQTEGLGRTYYRLVGSGAKAEGSDRYEKLANATRQGVATFRLEVQLRAQDAPYHKVAEIRLLKPLKIDQQKLLFYPFRAGRGIVPEGFLQSTRHAAYLASYIGRNLRPPLGG